MRNALRRLTQNWQLKLAALSLAVLLWVVVSAEQITTQWIPVPVRVTAGEADRVVTGGPVPREVEVRFAGPGRELWELALERPVLVLPLVDVEEENQVFELDPRMVRVPNGLSVTPQDVRPSSVRVSTQRLVTREVPVRVRIGGRARERYVVLDTPRAVPRTVRVTGAEDRVARLTAAVTEPLELAGADSVFLREVRLDEDSLAGLRPSAGSVRVSARVDRIVERIIPSVPVSPVPGAAMLPARVDVRVQGPARRVRALDAARLAVAVAADSLPGTLPPGGIVVPVRVAGLPPGLTGTTVPATVRLAPPEGVPPAAPDTAAAAGAGSR